MKCIGNGVCDFVDRILRALEVTWKSYPANMFHISTEAKGDWLFFQSTGHFFKINLLC